ncbi:MAG: SulP family inorganic anion transporter [Desulfobacterales bacterium]|jgi:MFS superfamily sulfate permease-like transporter
MISRIFPFWSWFNDYGPAKLKADALAGLTVALVLIPQSMAYAQLAGLPAYYGLYASFLPPLIAALFGSSRQLATGPVAVVSLMTAASLEPLAATGSEGFIAYAILLALIVGLFQFLLGVLRLGVVVNFLSHPVVIGFSNAAALIIASSQLAKFFGVDVDKAEHHYETVIRIIEAAIHYTHWPTLMMGAGALAVMLVLKKMAPRFPSILAIVVITIIISMVIGLEDNRVDNIDTMRSPAAKDQIWDLSIQSGLLYNLTKERALLYQKRGGLQKGSREWIALLKEIDLLSHQIRVARSKVIAHRRQVRQMLFSRVLEGREAGYYLTEELPVGLATDRRTWRLKVGSQPLDSTALLMTGGGAVIGSVPSGLPKFALPKLSLADIKTLLSYAVIIAILGFMEAISIAKTMATKTGARLDPNQELIGQGLGNIMGAIGQSYPTSGSFSRSAVNLQAGALTGMSSVITSLAVLVVLLFFTPFLYHLPQCVLAAIIVMAVFGLINIKGFIHAWKAQWYDGLIAAITFAATLYFAPHLDKGIFVGVTLSLLVFLYKSMRPQVVSLSRGEDQHMHAALSHGLKECRYIDMVRFDGPLFFANASFLEDKIIDHMEEKPDLRHIIIEASGIGMLDASGEEALSLIIDRVRNAGIEISFSGVHQSVIDVLTRTGMIKKIGTGRFFPNIDTALNAIYDDAHKTSREKEGCPLKTVIYADAPKSNNNIFTKLQPWRLRHN